VSSLRSIDDVDLSPRSGKTYFSIDREWREEFIYFLLVDRFDDGNARATATGTGRSTGVMTPSDFWGGTLRGITSQLDYIAGLGCTAIWLSPVFENNANAYHGYDVSNYLEVDPHFGTKQDLVDLVDAAHSRAPPMRVILDVVINHSGNNWAYPFDADYVYSNDQQFPLDRWRRPDRPVPVDLRQERLYHRRGRIGAGGWDQYPEDQHGDVVSLKDFANDDDGPGSELINILIKAHCHWIREADVDGFRVDAVKHMGELACSRFCSNLREYAYALGKRGFFLFGEVATRDDALLDRYIGQNTSRRDGDKTVFFGLDSVLDFRLAGDLRWVLGGAKDPTALFDRLEAQRSRALNRGEIGRYLVTFADNHDGFWQPAGRVASGVTDAQVVGTIGYLLCALGTPCIYYGTEQGLEGGPDDNDLRRAMFEKGAAGKSLFNTNCAIYTEIAQIAAAMRSCAPLRFGRMYFRPVSGNGSDFGMPYGTSYTLAFSRILYPREILVAYNVSRQPRSDWVVIDANLHKPGDRMTFLHPAGAGSVPVQTAPDGSSCVQLQLRAQQFAILE
jgi:glycosidase